MEYGADQEELADRQPDGQMAWRNKPETCGTGTTRRNVLMADCLNPGYKRLANNLLLTAGYATFLLPKVPLRFNWHYLFIKQRAGEPWSCVSY